jgi:hypothetical protein
VTNIFGLWAAGRMFGGNTVVLLISYAMFSNIYYGQVVGLITAGLALQWWGMSRHQWEVAGLGLALAVSKYQIGVPWGLTLLLLAPITWYARLRMILVVLIVLAISLVIYPEWPYTVVYGIVNTPPDTRGNVSFWELIGAASLLFWIPCFVLPLSAGKRLVLVACTASMAIPYFQSNDLVSLLVLPIGWLGLVSNLGFAYIGLSWDALKLLRVFPLLIYFWIVIPVVLALIQKQSQSAALEEHTEPEV